MIVKGKADSSQANRVVYPLDGRELLVRHFVVRRTTPASPFAAHRHENAEIWFIVEGRGVLVEDDGERPVEAGDLIAIESGALHGLRTDGEVRWICMG
jgi:mannose-6-phosphate isomerase-like protein (cupin superfamily)